MRLAPEKNNAETMVEGKRSRELHFILSFSQIHINQTRTFSMFFMMGRVRMLRQVALLGFHQILKSQSFEDWHESI